jgi:hypothetical protein
MAIELGEATFFFRTHNLPLASLGGGGTRCTQQAAAVSTSTALHTAKLKYDWFLDQNVKYFQF